MNPTKLIFSFSLLILLYTSQGQSHYTPMLNNKAEDLVLESSIDQALQQDLAKLGGPNKKMLTELYKERHQLIKDQLNDQLFITHSPTQEYLRLLVKEIAAANPSYNISALRIYFSRAWWANASSMGEGTILFNISLFARLENESQAAFVLCHELAHYFLNHGNNNIERYVTTINSDAVQQELKEISKQQYGKNSRLESLAKGLLFRTRRHGREYERSADSMAIVLMKNTCFDLRASLQCLSLLDTVDRDKYSHPLLLQTRFNFPQYPFKKSWLEEEEQMGFVKEEVNHTEEDSLKTHPDCSLRIKYLETSLPGIHQKKQADFITSKKTFDSIRAAFDYEIIRWCYETKRVSRALYYTLEMISGQPTDPFLNVMVAKCLNKLYEAQKNHQLSNHTDLPGKTYPDKYNELLRFIQNLRLKDIAHLSLRYLENNSAVTKTHPDYESVLRISQQNFSNHP